MENEERRCLTNAEKLRAMTDEEMTQAFLVIWHDAGHEDPPWCSAQLSCEQECHECVLHWLRQVSI